MRQWLILTLVTLIGFAALFTIDNYYREQIRQENRQKLATELESTKERLEESIAQRILVVEDLRAFMLASPSFPDSKSFEYYAASVLTHSPETRALEYVDSDHIIRYVYPLLDNEEALNLDLMTRPAVPFVEKAIETRTTTVNNPTVTVQDSLSIVIRSPIYNGDHYLGLVQGVVDITSLISNISEKLAPQFDIQLKDANGIVFWPTETPTDHTLNAMLQVGDNRWQLNLGWVPPEPQPEPFILRLIWGLGGALLVSVLLIINVTFRRLAQLTTAVANKTDDLAQSEARYRTLVESADDAILLTDLEGHILFRNKASYITFGFNEGEDIEGGGFAGVHLDDQQVLQKQMNEIITTNTQSSEFRVRHKDGHWIYCFSRANLIRDDQGNPQAILVIIRDITERKQAEEAIKFQAHLLDTVEQAVMATDLDGVITYWNKFAEELYGWSAAEVIGRNVIEVTPSETTQKQASEIMAEMKQGNSWSGEFLVRRKNGSSFPASVTNSPIYNNKGTLVGIVGISSDITERKRREQELLNTRNLLQKTFASLNEAVLVINPADRTIVLCNTAVERIFGYSIEDLIGENTQILHVDQESYARFAQISEPVLEEAGVFQAEFQMRRKDGQIIITEHTVTTLIEGSGWSSGVVSVVRDITKSKQLEEERMKLEKQFYQAQKMEAIGQLTAGIAHDFNNLLTVIKLYTELIQKQLPLENPIYAKTDTILQASGQAADLIRQLLIFSRKQIGTPRTIELNAIITKMTRMIERIIGETIQVRLKLTSDLWLIKVDLAQLEQAVINLMINARDAMPEGGELIIETANMVIDEIYTNDHLEVQPGEYVLLAISDTGKGMSQEVKDRLFEPFFTTKEMGKGTGLGLAMVYGFVKQSRGHIWLYTEEGIGTTFKIYLPRTTEVYESYLPSPTTKDLPRGQETILVVEDNSNIRILLAEVLRNQGYTVLEAEDSQQAMQVAAYHTSAIHLLLTDVIMPGMSGRALAEELVKQYPELQVIYMSGYSNEVISHHGILEPGTNLLQKPFSFSDLVYKVREILG